MALDFTALQTELAARGFAFLADGSTGQTRLKRWINSAMHSIDNEERWDYRKTSTTGTTPLTITDLGAIETVKDSNSNTLVRGDQDVLQAQYDDLTTTGTALYYYIVAGALKTYPVTTLTLTVTYWKNGPDLSSGSDAPLMPDQFRDAIIERAASYAYRDQDDPEMSSVCAAAANEWITQMREYYVLQPGPARQTITGAGSTDW